METEPLHCPECAVRFDGAGQYIHARQGLTARLLACGNPHCQKVWVLREAEEADHRGVTGFQVPITVPIHDGYQCPACHTIYPDTEDTAQFECVCEGLDTPVPGVRVRFAMVNEAVLRRPRLDPAALFEGINLGRLRVYERTVHHARAIFGPLFMVPYGFAALTAVQELCKELKKDGHLG